MNNKVRELLGHQTYNAEPNILFTSLVCVPYSLQPGLISIEKMLKIRYDEDSLKI